MPKGGNKVVASGDTANGEKANKVNWILKKKNTPLGFGAYETIFIIYTQRILARIA